MADGAVCPSTGYQAAIQDFVDACVQSVAVAVGGGPLVPDPVTCRASLGTCTSDVSSTNADLTICSADLGTCEGDLASCGANTGLPATGQTTSYGTGSDGDLHAGTARSFTDNGDGTITDNVTSLMWKKKSDDDSIHDMDNVYTWSTGTDAMDGTITTTFLATLNGSGGFAGHADWRVPNVYELFSLQNFAAQTPSAFPAFNTDCAAMCTVTTCSCTTVPGRWTSSSAVDGPLYAYVMMFDAPGGLYGDSKVNPYRVRAVRAGS